MGHSHHVYDGPPPALGSAQFQQHNQEYNPQSHNMSGMQQYIQPLVGHGMEHQYYVEQTPTPESNYQYGNDPYVMSGFGHHEYNHWTLPTTEEE